MTNFTIIEQPFPGVKLLQCPHYPDDRGDFTKIFNNDAFSLIQHKFSPAESFITRSKAGVIRGMHYQDGPASHDKLVCCLKGRVLDVVVDIRRDSPDFNKPVSFEMSEHEKTVLLISKGYAHGFLTLEEDSWMLYSTSTVHNKNFDVGVLWSSIAFKWPLTDPILSKRDQQHPPIKYLK